MVELVLFFECILEQCLEKNRERAAAYCKLLRCGDTGDTASRVGFAQPARFFCAVFGEEGKMALEIRDPADSRHHSNLLSGKSHGLQIRAAFVYNLHVGKVRPSSTGWSGPSFGFTANLRKRFYNSEDVWRSWRRSFGLVLHYEGRSPSISRCRWGSCTSTSPT